MLINIHTLNLLTTVYIYTQTHIHIYISEMPARFYFHLSHRYSNEYYLRIDVLGMLEK